MIEFRIIKDGAKWYGLATGALFLVITTYMRVKFVFDSGKFCGRFTTDLCCVGNSNPFVWIVIIAQVAGLDGFNSVRVRFLSALFYQTLWPQLVSPSRRMSQRSPLMGN